MTHSTTGRLIGGLILLQLVCGITLNTVLITPLFSGEGYLTEAALHATQLRWSVLFALLAGTLGILIALLAEAPLRQYAPVAARAFLVFSAVVFAVGVVEQAGVLGMIVVSEEVASATVSDDELTVAVHVLGASLRNAAHYLGLLAAGLSLLIWYATLLVTSLLPRLLAGFGVLATLLQLTVIGTALLGGEVNFTLLAPLALSQLMSGLWLLVRGFSPRAVPASV